MQLQTLIDIKQELNITYNSKIMMFGSCFSEHIGNRLQSLKFSVLNNPLGILFNPFSIAQTIERIILKSTYLEDELFEQEGIWNCFALHSRFSSLSKKLFLQNANQKLDEAHEFLKSADYLFITLGTAWVYTLVETGVVVANCHKMPSQLFFRSRKSVEEMVEKWESMMNQLRAFNPNLKLIFTVSPIRHWKDGAHDNQLSKSSLLLLIDEIRLKFEGITYFPAFEIMMDELRDYRFYAEDMIHPNSLAINYIWEKFSLFSFDEKVKEEIKEFEKISQAVAHKPFNPQSHSYQKFKENSLQQIAQLQKKYPHIDFQKEIHIFLDDAVSIG